MQAFLKATLMALVIPAIVAIAACDRQGPAEETGESIDETLGTTDQGSDGPFEKAGESVDDVGDEIEDSVDLNQ